MNTKNWALAIAAASTAIFCPRPSVGQGQLGKIGLRLTEINASQPNESKPASYEIMPNEGNLNNTNAPHNVTIQYDNGDVYFGPLTHEGELTGWGKKVYASGWTYEGHFLKGIRHGYGQLTNPNGQITRGEFKAGTFIKGTTVKTIRLPNGIYTGNVEFDIQQRMVVPNGHGELKFSNGYLYTGDFVNGTFEGHGTYKSKDHVYTGPFKNGTFNGNGTLTYANGNVYSGPFLNGEPHGFGKKVFANGDQYIGRFDNGVRNGLGKFTNAKGEVNLGEFKTGKLVKSKFVNIRFNGNNYRVTLLDVFENGDIIIKLEDDDVTIQVNEKLIKIRKKTNEEL